MSKTEDHFQPKTPNLVIPVGSQINANCSFVSQVFACLLASYDSIEIFNVRHKGINAFVISDKKSRVKGNQQIPQNVVVGQCD